MNIEFIEDGHIYIVDGEEYPSVTRILDAAGLRPNYNSESAKELGSYVALAIHLQEINDLDVESVDPQIRPYLECWNYFKSVSALKILQVEVPVANVKNKYAGRLDALVELDGHLAVIDAKTGSKAYFHQLQTYAYADCLERYARRYALYLTPSKTFSLVRHPNLAEDGVRWNAAVVLYHARKEQGLL